MVRVGFPGGPRLEWYDRNPSKVDFQGDTGPVAPGGVVQEWIFTVPTGKKAFLEGCMVNAMRRTAATTPGIVRGWVYVRNNRYLVAEFITNNVGDRADQFAGSSVTLIAGNIVSGQRVDLSTGGTCSFLLNALLTEFDA